MEGLLRDYERQYGELLREQYVATGANRTMTFAQFADWAMTTGAGGGAGRNGSCRLFDDFRWVEARGAWTRNWCDDSGPFIMRGSPGDPDRIR